MKIQIMGGKTCLRCYGETLLGFVNKLLKTMFCLYVEQTFQSIIWILTKSEGDGIESGPSS